MSETAPDPNAEDPHDAAIRRAEERLCMLRELAEIGMTIARAVRRDVEAAMAETEAPAAREAPQPAPQPTPKRADPVAAFARISRAIRLTFALEGKQDEDLRNLRLAVDFGRDRRRDEAKKRVDAGSAQRRQDHHDQVIELVLHVIDREAESEDAAYDMFQALEERLDQDRAYTYMHNQPMRDVVESLCADLQLTPDWSRWTGEDWGPPEPFFRPSFYPFRQPSRKPLYPLDPAAP